MMINDISTLLLVISFLGNIFLIANYLSKISESLASISRTLDKQSGYEGDIDRSSRGIRESLGSISSSLDRQSGFLRDEIDGLKREIKLGIDKYIGRERRSE